MILDPEKTLHETLAALGFTTRDAGNHGRKDILSRDGAVLFCGRAHEVWAWLVAREAQ